MAAGMATVVVSSAILIPPAPPAMRKAVASAVVLAAALLAAAFLAAVLVETLMTAVALVPATVEALPRSCRPFPFLAPLGRGLAQVAVPLPAPRHQQTRRRGVGMCGAAPSRAYALPVSPC